MWLDSTYQQVDRLFIDMLHVSLADSAEFLSGMVAFFAATWLLKQSVRLVANVQRGIYRTRWPYPLKKQFDTLLKIIKPNTAWLMALLLSVLTQALLPAGSSGVRIFHELLLLYIMYRLILLAVVFSLERAYVTVEKYTPEPILKKNYTDSVKLARQFSVMFFVGRYLDFYMENPWLQVFLIALIASTTLYVYCRLLQENHTIGLRFIIRQLPSGIGEWLKQRYEQHEADSVFVLAFLLAHLIRLFLAVHTWLLRFDYYKMLSARILRLHLEQKQQAEPEEESIADSRYERWFSAAYVPQTLIDSDSSRHGCKQLEEILDKWLADKALENDLLLTGPYGCGKTTAVKSWMETNAQELTFHWISIPAKTLNAAAFFALFDGVGNQPLEQMDDLLALDQHSDKMVIILDDCHNLFLSDINGFTGYKLLLECINAPLKNLFFVVMMNDESYIYLDDVFGWSQQYSYHIALKPWKVEDIRDLVMSRHKASKRKLVFDELLFAGIGNDELSTYSATADRCYRLLWEQASGIPALAMAIWAKAASRKERFTVEIGLPEKPAVGFLNDYPVDFLFIYSALARHQNLTQEEASRSTRLPEGITRRALKLGKDAGFLLQDESGRYSFHPLWAYPVTSYLRVKNYLHGN